MSTVRWQIAVEKSAVNRLLEETAELESRVVSSRDDLSRKNSRKQLLQAQIIESERSLDNGVQELENLDDVTELTRLLVPSS